MVRLLAILLATPLVLGSAACDRIERASLDDTACQNACACSTSTTLPGALEICVADCVDVVSQLEDPCLECVSDATCTELAIDACDDICFDRS